VSLYILWIKVGWPRLETIVINWDAAWNKTKSPELVSVRLRRMSTCAISEKPLVVTAAIVGTAAIYCHGLSSLT
jgi:hypothetical protein